MKLQLILLSLFVSVALALPVPDEEVSPVKAEPVGEIKSELVDDKQAVKQPVVDAAVKPEARASEDQKPPAIAEKPEGEKLAAKPAAAEEKPILLLGTPDAELAQALPEQKPEIKEKEKNLRADNQVAETKSLPAGVVEIPVVPAAVEEQKQIVEEDKPSVQDIQPAGKSADLTAAPSTIAEEKEPKIPEAIATPDSAPLAASASEIKPEETPARQERGNEQKIEAAAPAEQLAAAAEEAPVAAPAAAAPAEAPATKTLKEAEKPAAAEPQKQATTGDISKQSSEESNIKALPNEFAPESKLPLDTAATPVAEAKKIEEVANSASPALKPAEQPAKETPAETSEIKPLKKIEEPKDSSEERKDSAESKESAESEELKPKSDANKSDSDENKSN